MSILQKEKLQANKRTGPNEFYISDMNPHFNSSAQRFFKESINLEHLNIWK
jgi:glutamate racemase